MEFAGSLSHDLLPSDSAELQPPVKEVRPARLEISQMDNSTNQVQITTPDIAYHADLIDTELKQLQSHKFWMLNEALDVKDLSKKLGLEVAECKAICETLNKNVSDDKARVELLNESKCKLHETCSKLEVVLMVAKDKVQKKQQQLDELDRFEAKLAEEINSKRLRDAHAELQTHQQQVQIVAERILNTKERSEALLSQLSHFESGLKTENEARDKMLEQSSVFQEKKTTLQQQSQEENEEIKSLIRSATDTEKIVLEKQALHRELDTALVGLCAKVKLVADKKEKRGVELDSLMEVLKESVDEFSKIERTMEEIQKNASDFENTILKQQEKKNDLLSAKEALDSEKVSLDKQVSIYLSIHLNYLVRIFE
jgi:chromosome segregation ATPase